MPLSRPEAAAAAGRHATGPAIESFCLRLPHPDGPWLPALEAALRQGDRLPLRWAVTAVDGEGLMVEGARWAPC